MIVASWQLPSDGKLLAGLAFFFGFLGTGAWAAVFNLAGMNFLPVLRYFCTVSQYDH